MQSVLTRSETVLGGAERLAAEASSASVLRQVRVSSVSGLHWRRRAASIECISLGLGGEYLEPFCKAESERGFPS